jgi:hypothetical protein
VTGNKFSSSFKKLCVFSFLHSLGRVIRLLEASNGICANDESLLNRASDRISMGDQSHQFYNEFANFSFDGDSASRVFGASNG